MVHVPLMFLSERREFPSAPCLAGNKNLITARVSMLLKSRASPDMLPFGLCNKKRLAIRHVKRPPLSKDTIDFVLRHREVGLAKDLISTPSHFSWRQYSCSVSPVSSSVIVFQMEGGGFPLEIVLCFYLFLLI